MQKHGNRRVKRNMKEATNNITVTDNQRFTMRITMSLHSSYREDLCSITDNRCKSLLIHSRGDAITHTSNTTRLPTINLELIQDMSIKDNSIGGKHIQRANVTKSVQTKLLVQLNSRSRGKTIKAIDTKRFFS